MDGKRSKFGEMLREYRIQLGLSQMRLADRIDTMSHAEMKGDAKQTLSAKAISDIEKKIAPGKKPVVPHPSTVSILATALGFAPGTRQHRALHAAADQMRSTNNSVPERLVNEATSSMVTSNSDREPFVSAGRDIEVQQLQQAIKLTLGGSAQLVFLAGDAGLGKTFLLREIFRIAEQSNADLVVAWSECNNPRGIGEPYHPFKQLLGLLTGDASTVGGHHFVSAESEDRLERRSEAAIEAIVEHGAGLIGPFIEGTGLAARARSISKPTWWLSDLDQIVSNRPAAEQHKQEQLYEQYSRVLLHIAKSGPLALVIDDLHWADSGTCDLLFYLVRRLYEARASIILIGSYRLADLSIGTFDHRHPLEISVNEAMRRWGNAVIDLTPTVGAANGRAFVDALINTKPNRLDDRFRSLIFDRTDGQPMFTTELLRSLRERGSLLRDANGNWDVGESLDVSDLPGGVRAVIKERTDRLAPRLKQMLDYASVQGLSFIAEVIAIVLKVDRQTLAHSLDNELTRDHRLIEHNGISTVDGVRCHNYRFMHSYYQDYLYEELGPAIKETLHAETAAAMESLFGHERSDIAADIARQFELGNQGDRALNYFQLAADHARKVFDTEGAERLYRKALARAQAENNELAMIECLLGLATSLHMQGKIAESIKHSMNALDAARRLENDDLEAKCLTRLGRLSYDGGDEEQAISFFLRARLLFYAMQDLEGECAVEYFLAYSYYAQGDYVLGVKHAHNALTIARANENRDDEAESFVAIANYYVDTGDYQEAISYCQFALDCMSKLGDRRREAVCRLNIGLCLIELDQAEAAKSHLEHALEFGEHIHALRTQAYAHQYLGMAEEGRHNGEVARIHYELALRLRHEIGEDARAIDALAGIVRADLLLGNIFAAVQNTKKILSWFGEHSPDGVEYPVRVYLSCVRSLLAAGEQELALSVLEQGHSLLVERASKITDSGLHSSFLERVPFNRDLANIWASRFEFLG